MEDRGKQKDMEYIMSAYDLLKLEWGRVFKASQNLLNRRKMFCLIRKKRKKKRQANKEIKEKLKIFITQISGERSERTDSVLSKKARYPRKKEIS